MNPFTVIISSSYACSIFIHHGNLVFLHQLQAEHFIYHFPFSWVHSTGKLKLKSLQRCVHTPLQVIQCREEDPTTSGILQKPLGEGGFQESSVINSNILLSYLCHSMWLHPMTLRTLRSHRHGIVEIFSESHSGSSLSSEPRFKQSLRAKSVHFAKSWRHERIQGNIYALHLINSRSLHSSNEKNFKFENWILTKSRIDWVR